jgi:hypothetical protein
MLRISIHNSVSLTRSIRFHPSPLLNAAKKDRTLPYTFFIILKEWVLWKFNEPYPVYLGVLHVYQFVCYSICICKLLITCYHLLHLARVGVQHACYIGCRVFRLTLIKASYHIIGIINQSISEIIVFVLSACTRLYRPRYVTLWIERNKINLYSIDAMWYRVKDVECVVS